VLTTIHDEEFIISSKQFIRKAVEAAKNDDINNLVIENFETPGNIVVRLSKELLHLDIENDDCQESLRQVVDIVSGKDLITPQSKEKIWSSIHQLSITTPEHWRAIIDNTSFSIDSVAFTSLHHFVLVRLVEYVLSYENNLQKEEATYESEESRLSEDEQQIVRYVAGYILFSLSRKWQKINEGRNNMVATASIQFLDSVKITSTEIKAHSFLDFTNKWIKLVNRGGLVLVSDDFFILVRRIENCARNVLNVQMLKNY